MTILIKQRPGLPSSFFCFFRPVLGKQEITFEVDKNVNPSLLELLEKMVPLCNYYSTIVRFAFFLGTSQLSR